MHVCTVGMYGCQNNGHFPAGRVYLGEQLDPFRGDREGGRLALRVHELERIDAVGAVAPYLLPLLHMEVRLG